jgi:starch phosphorylase
MAKRSISTILAQYRASRMVEDYVQKFYAPASSAHERLTSDGHRTAREIAAWKARVRAAWPGVHARRLDTPPPAVGFGDTIGITVVTHLNGLAPGDVRVELVVAPSTLERDGKPAHVPLTLNSTPSASEAEWVLAFKPDRCGDIDYRVRVYPTRPDLVHPLETGLLIWL